MKFAYYPGCSLESTATEYDFSVKAVCAALGIELKELTGWSCCGASAGHSTDKNLAQALVGRNLAIAEKENLDIAVACPACYLRFRTVYHEIYDRPDQLEKLSRLIGQQIKAERKTRHLLDIIYNDVGLDAIRKKVTKPLKGLKLAAYYGCYLVRPPEVVGFDDPENPQIMDRLLVSLGAEVKDWPGKVDCCGGSLSLSQRDIAATLVNKLKDMAHDAGAEALVTACPLCQSNLETRQTGKDRLPVFYFTELMCLAMDIADTGKWFKKHLISPVKLLSANRI